MAATEGKLHALHELIAEALSDRIQQDMKDDLPTDAATLGAAIKFLKDNNITSTPADSGALKGLQDQMAEAARKREERRKHVLSLVENDMKTGT